MNVMRRLLPLVLWLAFSVAARAAGISPDEVQVEFRDDTYFGRLVIRVPVPHATALDVLTDFDHMAAFVPNVTSSRLLARVGDVYRVAQEGKARFGPFSFRFSSERRIEVFPEGRIVSRGLSGSSRYMRSELRLSPDGGSGVRIDYRIEVVPEDWLPSAFGAAFLRHELSEQFSAMAGEMLRRRQAQGSP